MKLTDVLRKMAAFFLVGGLASLSQLAFAQEDRFKDYREVYRDTTDYVAPTEVQVKKDTTVVFISSRSNSSCFCLASG